MAIIDIGPRPGSIPMKVPMMQPPTTINKFLERMQFLDQSIDLQAC